jgi:hypothetical protein
MLKNKLAMVTFCLFSGLIDCPEAQKNEISENDTLINEFRHLVKIANSLVFWVIIFNSIASSLFNKAV